MMLCLRRANARQFAAGTRLTYAEHDRRTCLANCGSLVNVARAMAASAGKPANPGEVTREADRLYGGHLYCPEGGRYEISPDGKQVTCTVHGSPSAPRQPPIAQAEDLHGSVSRITATLTFLEDGLRAVLLVERAK